MKYTTIAIDKYGKIYDLRYEHPSWEQQKKGQGTKNIVVNAMTISVEELEEIKN